MNTKTDQISSGLVAHIAAFKEALNGTKGDLDAWLECNDESEVRQAIFGVISDAEAIINDLNNLVIAENQRKQQLEEERDTWKARAELSYAQRDKQSAALKLAKDAFSAINIEAKTFMSYENARNNFSDDTDERNAYERAMVKASEFTKQALAAIDALKGE